MKVLLTGSEGFIGKRVAELLESKGHKVVRFSRSLGNNITNLEECKKAASKVDAIIHCAAILDERDPKLFDVNVTGTENISIAASEANVEKLVIVSSAGIYGETKKPANEKTKPKPETNYEKTKYLAELAAKKHYKNVIIARPALVLGPNIYWKKIVRLIKKGFPLIGNGKNYFHLAYIDDVAKGVVLLLEKGKESEAYNIACEEPLTLEQVVIEFKKNLGLEAKITKIPLWLGKFAAFVYSSINKKSILTPEHIRRLTRNRIYEIKKIKKLGLKPLSMKEAIRNTANALLCEEL